MRVLPVLLLALATPLAAQTVDPVPAPSAGADTTLSLNAKILAELRAQAANRAAQAAQYKGAVAVQNQQTIEVQRIAQESEADYTARLAAWKIATADACKAGNPDACAKLNAPAAVQ